MEIHNIKRQFERNLKNIEESKEILKDNKNIIFQFKDYLLSEGIGICRINRYFFDLKKYDKLLNKPFNKATKQDIRTVIAKIEQTDFSAETKKVFKILVKKLHRYLEGIEEEGVYPECVKWICTKIPKNKEKLPEELLTEDETEKIIKQTTSTRDRALIATIAESGARVSEIGTMQIKHVSFEEYGARLNIQGKTGMRKILVINASPYLQDWINQHPENKDPNAPLWYNPRGDVLSYTRIAAILKTAAKRAGIRKRVYLHLLRHSRATQMAKVMTEASMKQYFGWTQASDMASVYIHMSGKDTDDAVLRANGIEINKEEKKPKLKPKECVRCKTINPATNRFCKTCGLILDQKEADEILQADMEKDQAEDILNKILKDRDVLKLIKKKMENLN